MVKVDARICRYCGHDFVSKTRPVAAVQMPQQKSIAGGCLKATAIFVGLMIGAVVLVGWIGSFGPPEQTDAAKQALRESQNAAVESYLAETGQLPGCGVIGTYFSRSAGGFLFYCQKNGRRFLAREDNFGRYQIEPYD